MKLAGNTILLTGGSAGASPLLSDMVLRNTNGTMTLTIDDLAAGTYDLTTFHHSSQFGGGSVNLVLNDANGSGQSVITGLPISGGTNPTNPTKHTVQGAPPFIIAVCV